MRTHKDHHIIYLVDSIEDEQWSHLHRFIHPGSRNQAGWKSMLCADLEFVAGGFLYCRAKDYQSAPAKRVFLRLDLVASILELPSRNDQLGFVHPDEILGKPQDWTEEIEKSRTSS